MNLQTFGGRRFLLTVGAGIATTYLQATGKLDPAGMAYVATISATVGAYIASGVIENKQNLAASKEP